LSNPEQSRASDPQLPTLPCRPTWRTSARRSFLALLAAVSVSLAALVAVAPAAFAHTAHFQVGCGSVTFMFSGFPSANGNTVNETITVDGSTIYHQPFTFNGPAASNTVTVNLSGNHTVVASAHWNTNGVRGSASSGNIPLSCPSPPTCPQNSISTNFNGNAIAAGDYIWFNSVAKVNGVPSSGGHVFLTNVHVHFTANGIPYTVNIPGGQIYLSPSVTTASTFFSKGQEWITSAPAGFGDDIFLSGLGWQVPSGGLPGGIQNVTWQGDFTVSAGMTMSWQWAAAVYTQFVPEPPLGSNETTNAYTTLDVKVLHSTSLDAYHNGDQAGTPENRSNPFIPQPINGATGGGAANYTGSYSATGHCP
jgi:hypothetical protein